MDPVATVARRWMDNRIRYGPLCSVGWPLADAAGWDGVIAALENSGNS